MVKKGITDKLYIDIKDTAKFLFDKGWAERNAGNFSYRLSLDEFEELKSVYKIRKNISLLKMDCDIYNECSDFYFLISISGSKFRDIMANPIKNICIAHISKEQSSIYVAFQESKPSSEFPSHTLIHFYLCQEKPEIKAVLHTHPTNIIAFSHKYNDFDKKKINKILNSTMPEVSLFIQNGIGVVNLLDAGSFELAQETLNELKLNDVVIWKKHGCISVAENLWEAVDQIDILDKAANIALLAQL
ncbi:MAG: rhamnulose-1-phosphate aldolase [Candidatus Cloacimonetes bacterium]|nr:rhamnulose-1-phosphate aldolase [Candidatus Cloacimonadota bacterium]